MHIQYPDRIAFAIKHSQSCSSHLLKPPTAHESVPGPPRPRTSISRHPGLTSNDALCDIPAMCIDISANSLYQTPTNHEKEWGRIVGSRREVGLKSLPEEIQQRILDMLMGELRPTSLTATDGSHALRNWNHAMRHPRSHWFANLAVVSLSWRRLIQERLYRHVKVQGTTKCMRECTQWFLFYPHLCDYVRHIEFWVPVWEKRVGLPGRLELRSTTTMDMAAVLDNRLQIAALPSRTGFMPTEPVGKAYKFSSQKATLDELFTCVSYLFRYACVLTIEGGHCKRPPMIQHFRSYQHSVQKLTSLPSIRTFVLRGAWNVMREESHFHTIVAALPNMKEWHCTYTKPKIQGYKTIYALLPHLPSTLTHLNICLEGFYNKKTMNIAKVRTLRAENHFCTAIGSIIPQLEVIKLTGRVCNHLFETASHAATKTGKSRLRCFDLVVKNCCRNVDAWNDGAGIHNSAFILAFEQLVTSATRALNAFPELNCLRIRFVDLDTPCPLLNPYFQLQGGECAGIWSDEILNNLVTARPEVFFVDIAESCGGRAASKVFSSYPARRPKSIKVSSYHTVFADGPLH